MEQERIVPIGIILLIHFSLMNPLSKLLAFSVLGKNPVIQRPRDECANTYSFYCLGMPSGHSEIAALASALLYMFHYISLPVAAIIALLFGLQRIYAKMHTVLQVLVGWSIGLLFALVYRPLLATKTPWLAVGLSLGISFVLSILYALHTQYKMCREPNL